MSCTVHTFSSSYWIPFNCSYCIKSYGGISYIGNIYLSLHQYLCVWTVGVHSPYILSITYRFLKFTNASFIKNTLLTTYLTSKFIQKVFVCQIVADFSCWASHFYKIICRKILNDDNSNKNIFSPYAQKFVMSYMHRRCLDLTNCMLDLIMTKHVCHPHL